MWEDNYVSAWDICVNVYCFFVVSAPTWGNIWVVLYAIPGPIKKPSITLLTKSKQISLVGLGKMLPWLGDTRSLIP